MFVLQYVSEYPRRHHENDKKHLVQWQLLYVHLILLIHKQKDDARSC